METAKNLLKMRFVYRNRKLALFGMFFLFGAMMILIKFTEFSPTCLFKEDSQQGPVMVRDQVIKSNHSSENWPNISIELIVNLVYRNSYWETINIIIHTIGKCH